MRYLLLRLSPTPVAAAIERRVEHARHPAPAPGAARLFRLLEFMPIAGPAAIEVGYAVPYDRMGECLA